MKSKLLLIVAFLLLAGQADVSAQGLLKKIGKTVKKEVVDRTKKEVNKQVKKEGKASSDNNKQQQESPQQNQEQSLESSNERHLRILEERGEIARTTVVESQPSTGPAKGKTNGHEWVDLGLPSGTRWATCNIGATQPHLPGVLYAWGEKAAKTSYVPENSKTHGKEMDDISGNATYDVATAKWGNGWRMPTKEEFDELVEYCPFPQYVKQNGRYGQLFTNQLNGRTLFLPTTGSKEMGSRHEEANTCGLYWTSTPHKDSFLNGAHQYHYGAAMGEMGVGERSSGFAVRAVIDNDAMITIPAQGATNGHEWVDLGLPSGTKWATCNIGAKSAEEYGKTFGWAKLTPKEGDRRQNNEAEGKDMGDIGGDASYDTATALWGDGWRMPSIENFKELMDNCTWEYTKLGRVNGCKGISKINGNYIFLPIQFYEKIAKYWSSTPSKYSNSESMLFVVYEKYVSASKNSGRRSDDFPIRPVTK